MILKYVDVRVYFHQNNSLTSVENFKSVRTTYGDIIRNTTYADVLRNNDVPEHRLRQLRNFKTYVLRMAMPYAVLRTVPYAVLRTAMSYAVMTY
jgi:hypothetical protein